MSVARDQIIGRIRQSLGRTAESPVAEPPPVYLHGRTATAESQVATDESRGASGSTGTAMTEEERIERFGEAFRRLGGQLNVVANVDEAREMVRRIARPNEGQCVFSQGAWEALRYAEWPEVNRQGYPEPPKNPEELREAAAALRTGVSGVTAFLAETGTIVLEASAKEPRLISLLPPVHVAVGYTRQLLGSLDDLLATRPLPVAETCSLVLITGPSRTGDIEQVLVRGVHGPGTIHVIMIKET